MAEPESPFWDFSLQLYQQPEVAQCCLALQDEYDADVNILLFCCWLGSIGAGPLSLQQLQRITEQVAPWREQAILPLRAVRRQLKNGVGAVAKIQSESVRQAIQRIEIEAERVEQLIISDAVHWQADAVPSLSFRTAACLSNLQNYFSLLEIQPDERIEAQLQTLITAASAL